MSVTKTENVTQTLEEVNIHYGGSVSVTIKHEVPGLPPVYRTYEISQAEATPYWGVEGSPGLNRWQDLCGLLYQILVNRGDLTGNMS